jgi:hypothetical protein
VTGADGAPAWKESEMAKYLFLYRGPATPMEDFTPEQGAEQMAAWGAWMDRVGAALVDPGQPIGAGTAVVDDGSKGTPSDQNGYSIVEADSLEAAAAHADKHPFLAEGKGRFQIEVFELLPMPGV